MNRILTLANIVLDHLAISHTKYVTTQLGFMKMFHINTIIMTFFKYLLP